MIEIKEGEEFIKSWEDCGYKIYSQVINTKDYGIPQSRPRVFFVGIRKDINQNFSFPEKEELKIFIKDILEQEVDSKYLLKEHQVKKLLEGIEKKNRFMQSKLQTNDYAFALKGRDFKEPKVVQIDISGKGYKSQQDRFYNAEGVMCCLPNAHPDNKVNIFALRSFPRTDNPEQDKIDGRFQNMEKDNLVIDNRYKDKGRIYDGISPTLNSHGDTKGGVVTPIVMNTIQEAVGTRQGSSKSFIKSVSNVKEITGIFRRLTPKECFRLQGFLKDEIKLDGLSDTQAYRLAGNGQSVNVVSKILKELLQ